MTDEIIEDDGLDDVFDDAEPDAEVTEPEAEVEAEKVETEPEAETEKVETEVEDEEPTASKQKSVPVAALQDERKKRQTAEEKAAALEKELEEMKGKPDPVPDTEFDALVKVSVRHMRKLHDDYPEMEKIFMDQVARVKDGNLVIKNEDLWERYRESEDPAEFVYSYAKSHKDYLDKTSPDYEEKLRKRIEEDILKDLKKRKLVGAELPNLTSTAASDSNTEDVVPGTDDEGIWD